MMVQTILIEPAAIQLYDISTHAIVPATAVSQQQVHYWHDQTQAAVSLALLCSKSLPFLSGLVSLCGHAGCFDHALTGGVHC